jgi:hypothetical protein
LNNYSNPATAGCADASPLPNFQTIAMTFQPILVLAAMRQTAAAIALAGPMLLGGMAGSAGAAPAGITINYSVTINASPDE